MLAQKGPARKRRPFFVLGPGSRSGMTAADEARTKRPAFPLFGEMEMDDKDGDPPSREAMADGGMIVPGNNRRMQRRRAPRRKLFGARRKEIFLEHLSCTANVAASAAAAGVSEGCVYAHRRADPEFREAFWMALEQGVAKLVALRLQRELERAEGMGQSGDSHVGCPQTVPFVPLALRLDGPPDEKQILDLVKLMQALRDLCRNLSAGSKPGRPRHAELDEVCAALTKRLKAFPPSPEQACEDDASGRPLHRPSDGPPPRSGEEL